jgi:hypothetical protein
MTAPAMRSTSQTGATWNRRDKTDSFPIRPASMHLTTRVPITLSHKSVNTTQGMPGPIAMPRLSDR